MDPFFRILVILALTLLATLYVSIHRGFRLSQLWYDDFQLVAQLDDRFPYLQVAANQTDGSIDATDKTPTYIGPRDYFNFTDVFTGLESNHEKFANKNVEQYLYEEFRAMEITASIASMDQWHYSDVAELKHLHELDDGKRSKQCEGEIRYLKGRLLKQNSSSHLFEPGYGNVQLTRWIDSWGRPPSETYLGNSYWTGSYRGCRQLKLPAPELGSSQAPAMMGFRFCWLKLRAKGWPELRMDEMRPRTSIKVGICVPESCTSKSVKQQMGAVSELMQFNFSPAHKERFASTLPFDVYCLPDDDRYTDAFVNQSPAFRIVLACVAVWLLLIVAASLAEFRYRNTPASAKPLATILDCLSVQSNFVKAVDDNEPGKLGSGESNQVDLRPLGVFKLLASLVVVAGHNYMSMHWVFYSSTVNVWEFTKPRWCWWQIGFKVNDVFMLISGMITSYGLFTKFAGKSNSEHNNAKHNKNAPKADQLLAPAMYLNIFLFRYLRLAPMLVLVLVVLKSMYPLLSSGPFWDYGTYKYSLQGRCQRESWLRTLFPLLIPFDWAKSNPYFNECLPVSWYLMTDLKLALIAPLFVYLVLKSRHKMRTSLLLTVGANLISMLWQYKDLSMQRLIHLSQGLTYGYMYAITMLGSTFSEASHYSAVNRLSGFALGLFTGHILYLYKIGRYKHWPPRWLHWVWVVLGAVWWWHNIIYSYYVNYHYRAALDKVHSGLLDANSAEVRRNVPQLDEQWLKVVDIVRQRIDTIVVAMIMLRSSTDWSKYIMAFTKPLFKVSKLAFCVYLIHTVVISYSVSSHEKARLDTQPYYAYLLSCGYVAMSFAIAFPLYILIESPFKLLLDLQLKKATVQLSSGSKQKES